MFQLKIFHFRNLYAFIIYLKVLLVIDAGPYFRMGMDPWETISTTSLVRYWFLQTTQIRCSKSVIERSKNIQDEQECTSLVRQLMQSKIRMIHSQLQILFPITQLDTFFNDSDIYLKIILREGKGGKCVYARSSCKLHIQCKLQVFIIRI